MRQSDIHETMVEPLVRGMNLVDMAIDTDNSGEIQEVLLKYVPQYQRPERMPAGGLGSRRLCGADPAV